MKSSVFHSNEHLTVCKVDPPLIHQHTSSILLSATQEILLKNKNYSQIDFVGGEGADFTCFYELKLKAEMENLKVTNPITVKKMWLLC